MPVRAIIKPVIYSEWRFSCACRAIMISLKSPSRDGFFADLGGIGKFALKITPVWHSLKGFTILYLKAYAKPYFPGS